MLTVSERLNVDPPSARHPGDPSLFWALCLSIYRNWRTCLGILVACWLLAAIVILLSPTTYEASSQVLLEPLPRKPVSVVLDGVADPLDSAQADSRLQVVKSERLLRFVFNTIDWRKISGEASDPSSVNPLRRWLTAAFDPSGARREDEKERQTRSLLDFMNRVSVRRLGLSYVIEISFRAPTPRLAASVTNSITAAYLRSLVIASQLEDELLQRRLANVESEKLVLFDAIRKGVIPEQNFLDANARVISAAFEPLSKSSPKSFLIFLMATVVGITGGLFKSWCRNRTDRSIRTGREPFIAHMLPLLSVCPHTDKSNVTRKGPEEAIGWCLMQRILKREGDERHNVIGFVAYGAKSGTTHVTRVIGAQMSRQAARPTLVDATLSRSSERARAASRNALTGTAAARRSPLDEVSLCNLGASVLVDPSKLEAHLKGLAKDGPVLVDLPPLATSLDALAVASCLDVIVIIVEADHTDADQVAEAIRLLGPDKVAGFVLNQKSEDFRLRDFVERKLRRVAGGRHPDRRPVDSALSASHVASEAQKSSALT